jgi:molybdopterin biosynthesis enzyme MoaB
MAGVRHKCLIINLPGSPGGVKDNLSVVLPALKHGLSKLGGDTAECAT